MDDQELLLERQQRILDTMEGKKTDRTPLWFSGDAAMMRYVNPEVTFGQMVREHERLTQTIVDGFLPRFPKIDILMAVDMNSRNIGAGQMAKTWLPGRELPENEMWQLLFEHIITEEDYDYILKHGWAKFNEICLFERLGYDPESLAEDLAEGARNKKRFHDAGFPFTFGGMCPETFDVLAFGRGMMDFFVDLCERPETIRAILDMMLDEYEENSEQQVREAVAAAEALGEKAIFSVQPGVQANCNLLSRESFEEFAWPSYKRMADFILNNGGYVHFHMDSNWTNVLDYFTDFPKGRCIFDTDGFTDLYKVRDLLGGKMAFTGSVAPATMAFGTPDDNYQAVKEQIAEMGDSFIAAPSCSLPANMPRENIDAMYAAIDEQ